jgi:hypothetical protein
VTGRTEPDGKTTAAYDVALARYHALYPALKPAFDALGAEPG